MAGVAHDEMTSAGAHEIPRKIAPIVALQIEGDTYGFVTGIDPSEYTDIDPSTTSSLTFTLQFRGVVAATTEDQLFLLTMNIIGDGTTLLGTKDIVIRVPGHG